MAATSSTPAPKRFKQNHLVAIAIVPCSCTMCMHTHTPLQGIKFLQAQGRLSESAEAVAIFLFKGELLNKRKIGDYLGEG